MSKRKVLVAALVLVGAVGAVAAFALSGAQTPEVSVAEAARGDLVISVSASGRVSADERIDLYPSSAGIIAKIEVTDGQRVSAGQVIAVLETAPLEAQLAQAEAGYAGAVAQREAAAGAVPGPQDRAAADAAVTAARSAYDAARVRYDAVVAGVGSPGAAELAQAQAAVVAAQAAATAAGEAYDRFYADVYQPAPEPRDPALEAALVALGLARGQAAAQLVSAQAALAALQSGLAQDAAVEAARLARDQAHAAYLGAVAQRDALARASSVGAALDAADSAIAAADAARDLAASALDDATIVAPVDGVVIFNSVSGLIPGGPVVKPAPGSSVSPAAAPFAIVVFNELLFTAQVDEADIARVEPGMTARVSLDGLPDAVFETEVLHVEPQSVLTVTGGTAFPVTMRITNRDDAVLIGMNGSVEIEVEMVADVVTVPIEALLEDAEGSYVYEVVDGTLAKTRIEAGRLTDTRASVLSGLAEGALIVTSDVAGISEGARVRTR